MISQPDNTPTNQPSSQPQAAGHLPHTQSAQFCFYSYRVAVCITAVTGGRCVWIIEPQRDSQTSEADVVSRWLVYLHFRRVAMCSHAETRRLGDKSGGQLTPDSSILTVRRGNPHLRVHRRIDRVWGNRILQISTEFCNFLHLITLSMTTGGK